MNKDSKVEECDSTEVDSSTETDYTPFLNFLEGLDDRPGFPL